jgi:cation diffusion facilitator family transporter
VASDHSTSHILQSLVTNLVIAAAKGVAALFTGSGAMLAETLHSAADCGNQLLLLMGVSRARRPPDATHPLGYGRSAYFWSFMVAQLLFLGGGVYSIYEGVHKIQHPEPVDKVWLGLLILGFSLALEGRATWSNIREMKQRARGKTLLRYIRDTKDSDLVVVFGENSAATLGLIFAMAALGLASTTGDPRWDGIGTLVIGLILVSVAAFLAVEIKSLLVGEAADPEIESAARAIAKEHRHLKEVLEVITMQQGPGEVMVSLKVRFCSELTGDQICEVINEFEAALRKRCPEAKWLFLEPDIIHSSATTEARGALN